MHPKLEKKLYFDVQVEQGNNGHWTSGLLKVTKILVFKNNLLDRKLYHFGGNWASSFYNRGTKVETRAAVHLMWE